MDEIKKILANRGARQHDDARDKQDLRLRTIVYSELRRDQ
jgi:hypothetical protein